MSSIGVFLGVAGQGTASGPSQRSVASLGSPSCMPSYC
jgi:hypothetical protein